MVFIEYDMIVFMWIFWCGCYGYLEIDILLCYLENVIVWDYLENVIGGSFCD